MRKIGLGVLFLTCSGLVQAESYKNTESLYAPSVNSSSASGDGSTSSGMTIGDPTVGVWYSSPLGASVRLGLGFKSTEVDSYRGRDDLVLGFEVGEQGTKKFIGMRGKSQLGWGGVDFAHWKTRSNPLVGSPYAEYLGVELQALIFRMGLMVPTENADSLKLTFGVGLSF